MAGAGYKLFAAGDVLSASDVNTYIMQQTVMVFASSAARTTALSGVLAEGMISYLKDTNVLEVYDGSAWVGATGDITELTAGTGVSITSATGPVPTVAIDTAVVPRLGVANSFTVGPQTLNTGAAGSIGLIVKGAASQTADLQQWQNSGGTTIAKVTSAGNIATPIVGSLTAGHAYIQTAGASNSIQVQTNAAANVGLIVIGAASQTGNLTEWRNSAGSVLAKISSSGELSTPVLYVNTSSYLTARVQIVPNATTERGIVVRGIASQTANLTEWQDSSGNILANVSNGGGLRGANNGTLNAWTLLSEANSGGQIRIKKQTAAATNPGADVAALYFRDGTTAGTLKLVVRAGASGAETTILDNIPQ